MLCWYSYALCTPGSLIQRIDLSGELMKQCVNAEKTAEYVEIKMPFL